MSTVLQAYRFALDLRFPRFRRGRWEVSFSVGIERSDPEPAIRGGTVGVDVGVKHLAVLSTGETIDNPK